ncbi:MAG: hypothetical protein QNL04_06970 [SAR324 cluster bacterium]|nr:hypothetical protein [SAR324 cluster bacterium]
MIKEKFCLLPTGLQAAVASLCQTYQEAGFECIVVGGSLRDLVLGLVPKDIDIATNCPIETSQRLFPKVIPTGVDHGTVTILHKGYPFEVTLFRKDVKNFGRKAEVEFGATWIEDQERRDLTINALGYNPSTGEVFDSQGAMEDFKNKVICFVGSASSRVKEDHLRYLRFLRFITKFKPLGFTYNDADLNAAKLVFDPSHLSVERIYDEFQKVFLIDKIDVCFLVHELRGFGLFSAFAVAGEVEREMLEKLFTLRDLVAIPFYAMAHFKGGVNDFRLPKKTLKLASLLLAFKGQNLKDTVVLKAFLAQLKPGEEKDAIQPVKQLLSVAVEAEILAILKNKEAFRLEDLAIKAKDLIGLGFSGKSIGEVQRNLLERVRETPHINNKNELISLVKSYKKNKESS